MPARTSDTSRPAESISSVSFGLLARLRDPASQPVGFSSYDRTGGNNDGFSGTYSKLRVENGDSVLAETTGPGIIERIWFTHTRGEKPGLLDGKQEHLRIYLDGSKQPALDIPLEQLFAGGHPHFPRPLVFEGSGGYVSYVPIPFRDGCKIVVEGQGVRFYQINILRLPAGTVVRSFVARPTANLPQSWPARWRHGRTRPMREPGCRPDPWPPTTLKGSATAPMNMAFAPGRPRFAPSRSIRQKEPRLRGKPRLRIAWDTDNSQAPAVDLPLGIAFGVVDGAKPYESLLMGQKEGTWYNRFPMPYRRQAILRIDTEKALKGTIRVWTGDHVFGDDGYFHAAFRQATPTRSKQDFTWLKEEGRGHFAGVLLMTEGKAKLPFWLEGDDHFTIDGRLAIHGTGTEDYFNCGWYALPGRLDGPACYPSYGFPVYRKLGDSWQAAAYRWHIADPVPFARSIDAGIEHGGENDVNASYRAAVFWYSNLSGPTTADR